MKKSEFVGEDVSVEISLLDYGIIMTKDENKDGSGTHFFVYRIDDDLYGSGNLSEKEINDCLLGKDWMKEKDISVFLRYIGSTLEECMNLSLLSKVSSLCSYFDSENFFGTDYGPITKEEAIELYLTEE